MVAQPHDPDHVTLRKLQRQAATLSRWAKEPDRTAAMAPVHAGRDLAIARRYGIVPDDATADDYHRLLQQPNVAKRVELARRAYYSDLARRSVAARSKAKRLLAEAEDAERELGA